mmetsp:Transcript_3527/g.9578  ORF Transcript_3527/g.9578 Transcript_3527/m.9578 type:complete len:255 (+) Transcript_3527:317-1081(+)
MQHEWACSHARPYSPPRAALMASPKALTSSWKGTFFIVRGLVAVSPQNVTPLISTKSGRPRSSRSAYCEASSAFHPRTSVSRYTVRCCLSCRLRRLRVKRSQKSLKSGRSMALSSSGLAASTETYSCVMGRSASILSGNWALVTRKVEMRRRCRPSHSALISGYMMGSPTRLSAQCRTAMASASRSGLTPGTPRICFTMPRCPASAPSRISSGGSCCHFHSLPTGLVWCRQQKVHLLAQARLGVASMQRWDSMP